MRCRATIAGWTIAPAIEFYPRKRVRELALRVERERFRHDRADTKFYETNRPIVVIRLSSYHMLWFQELRPDPSRPPSFTRGEQFCTGVSWSSAILLTRLRGA